MPLLICPTGDPIEVGAAAEVLLPPGSSSSKPAALVLASSKSFLGHAEPAAGVVGMLHAAHMLSHGMVPPIAHLQQLNPYVQAAATVASGMWSMPRQAAGLLHAAAASTVSAEQQALGTIGTSAFAFQGEVTPTVIMVL